MATKLHIMAGEPQLPPACVSDVLDNHDLLTEIIVRVGFPTSLVRAAGVCRRWLRIVSDHAFMCRFRKLHPPRLLGFYLSQRPYPITVPPARFFPMLPQPPPLELAAVARRTSFRLAAYEGAYTDVAGCWNGRVVIYGFRTREGGRETLFVVYSPLCSERGMVIPPLQSPFLEGNSYTYRQLFSKEEGDVLSYLYVIVESTEDRTKSIVHVHMLQNGDDAWREHCTLVVDYYLTYQQSEPSSVLVDNKIYMGRKNQIVVLDLTASNFSIIQLPQGVDFSTKGTTILTRADDAPDVYLIHTKNHQLRIWLHKAGNWLLKDNVCLREMCASFLEHEPTALIELNHFGNYSRFVFLKIGRCAFYLDVKCRTLCKVYEMAKEDRRVGRIYPFMMIWHPIFPALKD